MRFGLMVVGTGLALAMGVPTADAAPVAPVTTAPPATSAAATLIPAVATHDGAKLILVRGGCGWGAHRTWVGRCHFNYGWRGRVRARHYYWHHRYWR